MPQEEQFKRILDWQDKHEVEDRQVAHESKTALTEIINRFTAFEIKQATNQEILLELGQDTKEIKEQTIKTNGRVSGLENWRAYIVGGGAVIVTVIIPTLAWVIKQILTIKVQ